VNLASFCQTPALYINNFNLARSQPRHWKRQASLMWFPVLPSTLNAVSHDQADWKNT
jgi:hypothetical protein